VVIGPTIPEENPKVKASRYDTLPKRALVSLRTVRRLLLTLPGVEEGPFPILIKFLL